MCAAGSYSSDGLVPCVPCDRDHYSDTEMQTECQSCPTGTFTTNIGQDSIHDCVTACKIGFLQVYSNNTRGSFVTTIGCNRFAYVTKEVVVFF